MAAAMQLEALGDNEDMGSDDAVADEDHEMEETELPAKGRLCVDCPV
jgi:hypothetical protein